MSHTRYMLGSGGLAYLPETISGSIVELGVSLTAAEVDLLRQVFVALGLGEDKPTGLDAVTISEVTPTTDHRFVAVPPKPLTSAGPRTPASLALTEGPRTTSSLAR